MRAPPRFERLDRFISSGPFYYQEIAIKEMVVRSVVVYESHHGNTRLIAEAIAEGLGGAPALSVHEAGDRVRDARLVVVGGQTQLQGRVAKGSRRAPRTVPRASSEPSSAGPPALREWLRDLPRADGVYAAAFDTRLDKPRWLTGDAAHSIARRLAGNGYEVLEAQSFVLEDTEGPLRDGERERARAFGERLALSLSSPTITMRRATRARSRRLQGLRSAPGD
jgi:hypothetical protein